MPALTSIEVANIYDQNAALNLSANAWDSVTTVNLHRGDGDLTLTLGDKVTTVGLNDIAASVGVIVAADAALTSLTLNLSGIGDGDAASDITVTGAALTSATVNVATDSVTDLLDLAAATTINVAATGALTTALATTGTAALTISGAGAVNLGTLDTDINTVTATSNTGGLTATIGAAVVDTVLTGSAGNDVITASGADTIATADTLAVNAGAGNADILILGDAADVNTAADAARYTNFEILRVAATQNVSLVSGITQLQVGGGNGQTYSGLNATNAGNVQVRADETSATFALTTATGTSDALTVKLGTGLTNTAATNLATGVTVTGFETLNIQENGGATATAGANRTATVAAFTGATLNDINLTGRAVILSNIATTVAVDINGSALTGDGDTTSLGLTASGSAVAGSVITGSSVRDVFTIGAAGSTYNGGAGNDGFSTTVTLISNDGETDTTLVGGLGNDTLTLTNTTGQTLTDANFINISGFEALTLANTGAGDTSITTGGSFNAAFANGVTITSGVIATTQDIAIAGGLSSVAMTVNIAATSQIGLATETNSITTGSAADSVTYTDTDWVGVAGAAQGTLVINTRAGNDTISVSVGTLLSNGTTTGQAISITGGAGKDTITKVGTNSAFVTSATHFGMAAGDSSTTAWDEITGFDVANTTLSDVLNFDGTAAVSAFTATVDFGTIKSHSITNGFATFDDVADHAVALVINSSNLADVVGYLAENTATDGTVAFAYDSDASGTADAVMVFHNGTTDDLVMLAGITTGTLHATLTTATAGTIGIA